MITGDIHHLEAYEKQLPPFISQCLRAVRDFDFASVPDGKYEYLQGTSMASPVVAGAASVLLAYMPNLKPEQIIESLVKTANKSSVNAMINSNTNNRFDLISEAGGVIDLRKAAEYAFTNFYKASPSQNDTKPTTVKKNVKKPVKKVVKRK